jgi:HAD superfamily hydrolase (TIGR01509 family)
MVSMRGVKILIVDMDNTICDTFHTLSKRQWESVVKTLEKRGYTTQAAVFKRKLGKQSFKTTLEQAKLPTEAQLAAMQAYDDLDVKHLKLYSDAKAILDLDIPKVLVTRGDKKLQAAKIRHLGIAKRFKRIYYVPTMEKKEAALKQVLKDFKVKPKECLVIGDRIEEEILEGMKLGMLTALIDRPDWPTHRIAKPTISAKSLYVIADRLRHV